MATKGGKKKPIRISLTHRKNMTEAHRKIEDRIRKQVKITKIGDGK